MTSLVKDIKCDGKSIEIRFSTIPANIRYLLTLPDFSMDDADRPPLANDSLRPSTGPYYLTHLTSTSAELRINPFYPASLRANTIP